MPFEKLFKSLLQQLPAGPCGCVMADQEGELVAVQTQGVPVAEMQLAAAHWGVVLKRTRHILPVANYEWVKQWCHSSCAGQHYVLELKDGYFVYVWLEGHSRWPLTRFKWHLEKMGDHLNCLLGDG